MLVVVAHPDDECFAFGGAIALAVRAGVEVSCVCFTDGQAASNRGEAKDGANLGQIRREEFAAACEVLGVKLHEVLDYQDAQLVHADVYEAAKKIVKRIRTFKPQVVVTFGLDGAVNVHPDHSMVSAIASMAFHWAGRSKRCPELGLPVYQPQRLFHFTTDFILEDRETLYPAPWTCTLDTSEVLPLRIQAFEKHTSQLPVLESVRAHLNQFGNTERYVLMASPVPAEAVQMTSMFEGIVE